MGRPAPWRFAAAFVILAVSAFRIVYIGWLSPFDLATDEAHYWDWARHLDWSYYSKGPLVAWIMAASQAIFGQSVLAIRLPAVLCGALLLVAIYILTALVHRKESLAFGATAVTAILPAATAGSVLMTIDAPFVCLWAWGLVLGYFALFRQAIWAWPLLGIAIGLGVLAKYTMLLWPASAVLFCLFTPTYRKVLIQPGVWICAAMVAVCCLPILIWNIQHDWVSLKHVAGQAGAAEQKSPIRWLGPLEYLGGQLGVGVVVWTIIWGCGVWLFRPGRETNPEKLYLWWLSVPTFALFGIVSVRVGIQANWPIAGFVSGLILTADWLADRVTQSLRWRATFGFGCLLAALASIAALDSRPLIPIMSHLLGHDKVRNWDPTCRLRGWQYLAGEVDRICETISHEEKLEPILATDRWNIAGELGFYGSGNPHVLSVGRPTGDRYSQYDLWRPNPVDDAQAYHGRTFVLVGEPKDEYPDAFDHLDPPIKIEYREHGELVAWWWVSVGRGYRGFPVLVKSGRH